MTSRCKLMQIFEVIDPKEQQSAQPGHADPSLPEGSLSFDQFMVVGFRIAAALYKDVCGNLIRQTCNTTKLKSQLCGIDLVLQCDHQELDYSHQIYEQMFNGE